MKLHSILLVPILLLAQGCFITKTPGFRSGYRELSITERNRVTFVEQGMSIPSRRGGIVYAVTAKTLLQELKNNDSTLVYLWGPNCHSAVCVSLLSVKQFCETRGYSLYVITEYYDFEQMDVQPTLPNTILSINHKAYNSDYCPKYVRLFSAELRNNARLDDSVKYARYYIFHRDKFARASTMIGGQGM